jgi:hypothetical protein
MTTLTRAVTAGEAFPATVEDRGDAPAILDAKIPGARLGLCVAPNRYVVVHR